MIRSVPQHQFIILCIPTGLALGFLMCRLSRHLIGAYFDKKPRAVLNSNNFKISDQMALWRCQQFLNCQHYNISKAAYIVSREVISSPRETDPRRFVVVPCFSHGSLKTQLQLVSVHSLALEFAPFVRPQH